MADLNAKCKYLSENQKTNNIEEFSKCYKPYKFMYMYRVKSRLEISYKDKSLR